MNCPAPSHHTRWSRWLTLLVVGLLALGPFLHGHIGASHDTGFHLDGVHAVHAHPPEISSAMSAEPEESPALGVATSLPQPQDQGLVLLGMAWLLVGAWALPRRRLPHRPWANAGLTGPSAVYRPGLPPPSLAPPAR